MPEKTLRKVVQGFRDKARNMLRLKMISNELQKLFWAKKDLKKLNGYVENLPKQVARIKYQISKLDKKDPDYEDEKEELEERLKEEESYSVSNGKETKEDITEAEKLIKAIEEKIEKIEKGEIPVSIDKVKELVDEMIFNL